MIDKNNSCSTIGFEKRMDEYDIVFGTANDKDYELELNLFKIRERCNYHKFEARLLDLRERYTDTGIIEMARLMLDDSKAKATLGHYCPEYLCNYTKPSKSDSCRMSLSPVSVMSILLNSSVNGICSKSTRPMAWEKM